MSSNFRRGLVVRNHGEIAVPILLDCELHCEAGSMLDESLELLRLPRVRTKEALQQSHCWMFWSLEGIGPQSPHEKNPNSMYMHVRRSSAYTIHDLFLMCVNTWGHIAIASVVTREVYNFFSSSHHNNKPPRGLLSMVTPMETTAVRLGL